MIVVGGENLIDLVQIEDNAVSPNFRAIPGGSQYNCALALGRLGAYPRYITPISTDNMGNLLADTLTNSGVEVTAPRVSAPSSLAVVTLENGQPSYQFYRDGTAERLVSLSALKNEIPSQTKVFQIGSLSLCDGEDSDVWADLFVDLAAQGISCAVDPNVRPTFIKDPARYVARIERMMAVATLVKLSDEDLEWLYPNCNVEAQAAKLAAASSAKLFVLTKGSKGADLYTKIFKISVPAYPLTHLQDTVGAGDTFMAALNFQMMQAPDLTDQAVVRSIGEFAAKAAAINCERVGCNPPTLKEIEA